VSTIDALHAEQNTAATPERVDPPAQAERQLLEARAASRREIESILGALGYAGDLADELEREAWARGHTWRVRPRHERSRGSYTPRARRRPGTRTAR
jgi:hypothetical protein